MASNYSRFFKGIDDVFKDINRDNKTKKAKRVRDKIQSIVKLFKDNLHYTDFKLRGSEYRQTLNISFNVIECHLIVIANQAEKYTDDFIRYVNRENDPTFFTLVILALFIVFVIVCFFWFLFSSNNFIWFINRVLIAIIISAFIDFVGRFWFLIDSMNRSKRKSLEALKLIKDHFNSNIEKLKSTSVNTTTTLAENLQNLLVTTEELFKI